MFAHQPLVIIPKGHPYCACYREGVDHDNELEQEWLYQNVGKTWRVLPSKVIYGEKTADEYRASNVYLEIQDQLKRKPQSDATGHPINFCHHLRQYALYAAGNVGLYNMAGRSSWGCSPVPENRYEPWGPGVSGCSSGWAMELVAGHPRAADTPEWATHNMTRGGSAHEDLHCHGVGHPDPSPDKDGPQAWLSPMASIHFYMERDSLGNPGALVPREAAILRSSHFFN